MNETVANQAAEVAGGAGSELGALEQAFILGQQIGQAINSGVEAAGGWAAYLEQVGVALGNAE